MEERRTSRAQCPLRGYRQFSTAGSETVPLLTGVSPDRASGNGCGTDAASDVRRNEVTGKHESRGERP